MFRKSWSVLLWASPYLSCTKITSILALATAQGLSSQLQNLSTPPSLVLTWQCPFSSYNEGVGKRENSLAHLFHKSAHFFGTRLLGSYLQKTFLLLRWKRKSSYLIIFDLLNRTLVELILYTCMTFTLHQLVFKWYPLSHLLTDFIYFKDVILINRILYKTIPTIQSILCGFYKCEIFSHLLLIMPTSNR